VEARLPSDKDAIVAEGDAAGGNGGVEVGEGVEVAVGDGLVDVGPEGFGRLQLGGIGWQEDEADAVWHGERLGVPAGAVKDEQDDPVAPCTRLAGEEREGVLEKLLVDAGREIPEALAGGGGDEGDDVEPFETVVAAGERAFSARRPDPAQDWLQPDAVLVGGEGLDCRAGMALRLLGDGFREAFLKASCFSGVAALACCGRGRWIVQPIARSASQPRCSATRSTPSAAAIIAATFLAVQTPPSSGGSLTLSRNIARISGVRIRGFAPFRRRRSPNDDGPKRL
jgi:hypothetical protein